MVELVVMVWQLLFLQLTYFAYSQFRCTVNWLEGQIYLWENREAFSCWIFLPNHCCLKWYLWWISILGTDSWNILVYQNWSRLSENTCSLGKAEWNLIFFLIHWVWHGRELRSIFLNLRKCDLTRNGYRLSSAWVVS